jgi:SCY1-like protein 1
MGVTGSKEFPFHVDREVSWFRQCGTLWELHEGHSDAGAGEQVSIFIHRFSAFGGPQSNAAHCARETLKRSKTLLHPSFLRVLGGTEVANDGIYLVTEPVSPLGLYLSSFPSESPSVSSGSRSNFLAWGIYCLCLGLEFLHSHQRSHHCIGLESVFVSRSGDWKIGGVDFADDALSRFAGLFPAARRPPEMMNHATAASGACSSMDAWQLGHLVREVFTAQGSMPSDVQRVVAQLISSSPSARPAVSALMETTFVTGSPYVATRKCLASNLAIVESHERDPVLADLCNTLPSFPIDGVLFAILPALAEALKTSPSKTILDSIWAARKFCISQNKAVPAALDDTISAAIVDLFQRPDKTVRITLLNTASEYASLVSPSLMNDAVAKQLAASYADASPAVREAAIRATVEFAPRMKESNVKEVILRALWQLQADPEPAIRTNTVICIGKLAAHLTASTRSKILLPAFQRSMRDPFPSCRHASVLATAACAEYLDAEECASKAIPLVSAMLVAPEPEIRDAAHKCIQVHMQRIKAHFERPADGAKSSVETKKDKLVSWASSALKSLSFSTATTTAAAPASSSTVTSEPAVSTTSTSSTTATTTANVAPFSSTIATAKIMPFATSTTSVPSSSSSTSVPVAPAVPSAASRPLVMGASSAAPAAPAPASSLSTYAMAPAPAAAVPSSMHLGHQQSAMKHKRDDSFSAFFGDVSSSAPAQQTLSLPADDGWGDAFGLDPQPHPQTQPPLPTHVPSRTTSVAQRGKPDDDIDLLLFVEEKKRASASTTAPLQSSSSSSFTSPTSSSSSSLSSPSSGMDAIFTRAAAADADPANSAAGGANVTRRGGGKFGAVRKNV